MRAQNQLLHSRTRVRPRYALLPAEGYPTSRLPGWDGGEIRILAAPALGAGFVQYLFGLTDGGGTDQPGDGRTEFFIYVLSGSVELTVDGAAHRLTEGGFALIPPGAAYRIRSVGDSSVLGLRKAYEPASGVEAPGLVVGNQADCPADVWLNIPGARLQTLLPDEMPFDLAMNIFSFEPGYSLPYVETHVMEHGLLFLQGKGVYFLDDEWMEVEAGDFIWMGPYVPQSFYATGPVASRYLYYKNVNREIPL